MNSKYSIFSFAALIFFVNAETEQCQFPDDSFGECVLVSQCPAALSQIKQGRKPQICGFQGLDSLVCCEKSNTILRKSLNFCEQSQIPKNLWKLVGKQAVGGFDALPREFLHMASLGYGEDIKDVVWGCGGSLISYNYVLTAAHCISNKELGNVNFIRLGDVNLRLYSEPSEAQDFRVAKTFKHPEYRMPSKYHDVALIELDRSVRVSEFVRPACLYTERKSTVPNFIATGWGNIGFNGKPALHLQKLHIQQTSIEQCRKFHEINSRTLNKGIIEDMHICAGDISKDTCQGDSGGPLQQRNNKYQDSWNIHGIVSFGKPCGLSKAPGVYVRVSNYIDWIESVVWPN